MKKLLLIAASILIFSNSFANSIKALKNGSWTSGSTWSIGSGPANGDSVLIPVGTTVSINSNVNSASTYYIEVYGTLALTGSGSKLSISSSSTIYIYVSGRINGTSSPSETISIGSNQVYNAGKIQNVVAGPSYATSTTPGFIGIITLPVKFIGFSLSETFNNNVLIQWSTSEEVNSFNYEVERSIDGSNWNPIAYIPGAGNSKEINNYSYSDKIALQSVIYYRIKEVDINGSVSFTAIKSIKNQTTRNAEVIKIAASNHSVILQFPFEIKGKVLIQFVSLNGQVVAQQSINQPIGQVLVNPNISLKGNYIIAVSNGQDFQVAKQVIL